MAFGSGTITSIGGAASDLFAAGAYRSKAAGDKFEQQNYDLASKLADQNAAFTETSTGIKNAQLDRELYKTIGGTQADVAGAGFTAGGSALDIMRDSASQGALTHAVASEQGLITEAGYQEQGQSYRNMSQAAQVAIDADYKAADNAETMAAIKGVAAVASIFTGFGGGGGGGGDAGYFGGSPEDNPLLVPR